MSAAKKVKLACQYRGKFRMRASRKGSGYAFCTVCNVDVSIAGGGQHELLERHMKTTRHSSLLNQLESQPSISTTLAQPQRVDERATAAELLFTKFVVEHNLPFLVADHFSKLTKVMFPDSKIAAAYASGRTKTTAIVTHALAPAMRKIVDIACRSQPFTILCDGGNDRVDRKYFAILVRFWDDVQSQPVTRFFEMPICNIATAENLLEAINSTMEHVEFHGKMFRYCECNGG